jgi:hypothetical protein
VTSLTALLLVVHILLALSLLLPAVLLPLVLRRGSPAGTAPGRPERLLVAAQGRWAPVIGLGLVVSGVALIATLSLDLTRQPWLLVALAIYGVNLAIAMFIQRPRLRQLVGLGSSAGDGAGTPAGDDAAWRAAAGRLRSISYLMAVLIGAIGFLMMAKPHLW